MNYSFSLNAITDNWQELAWGALFTLRLSAEAMAISLVAAVAGALGRLYGPLWVRGVLWTYVELIRNTPFLVQIFLLFFGLPAVGVRLDPNTGALIAMVLNGSAYTIEIVRAGIDSIGRGQAEAAVALGLHRWQARRLIIVPQALAAVFSPLGTQFILLMLGSSVVSSISADDLTSAANDIQARTFRIFEVYIAAAAIYLAFSLGFSAFFSALNRMLFARPGQR